MSCSDTDALQLGVTCVAIDIDGNSTENAGAWAFPLFFSGAIKFKLLIQLGNFGSHVAALQTRRRAVREWGVWKSFANTMTEESQRRNVRLLLFFKMLNLKRLQIWINKAYFLYRLYKPCKCELHYSAHIFCFVYLKGIVHLKMKILSLSTHTHMDWRVG